MTVRSCGFLIVRGQPVDSFLLLKHPARWDLPKGHVDPGETDMQCALRELVEETGIRAEDIEVETQFQFETRYMVTARDTGLPAEKTLVIFLGRLLRDVPLQLTEHKTFSWFPWRPPHAIQTATIDPLLAAVAAHYDGSTQRSQEANISIQLNGQAKALPQGTSLADLLVQLKMNPRGLAVELNERIVPRTAHAATMLASGDKLEIVSFVGGG